MVNVKFTAMKQRHKKNEVCHECEQHLIDEMNRLAGTVESHLPRKHQRRQFEIEAAYPAINKETLGQ